MAVIASRGSMATSHKTIRRRFNPQAAVERAAPRAEETVAHIFARDDLTISIILGQPEAQPTNVGERNKGPDAITIPLPTAPTEKRPSRKTVNSGLAPSTSTKTAPSASSTQSSSSTSSSSTQSTLLISSSPSTTISTTRTSIMTSPFVARQSDLQSPSVSPSASASPATGGSGTQADVLPTQGGRVAAIGIAAGVFAGVAFIVMTAAFIYRYRKRKRSAT